MTVTVNLATVADSIAGLSISGVNVKDIDQIPENALMYCPLLIPQPNGFVSGIQASFETFGSNAAQKMDLRYTLNYAYIHSKVGSDINAFGDYAGLIANLATIIKTIMSNDAISGAVDIQLEAVGNVGVITDPAGNDYWGLEFSLRVLEYTQ